MSNRVNINITARDLTGNQLRGIRRNFNALGQDIDRAVTDRTRQNFDRLRESANRARRDLAQMRGSIPDDEFFRLDESLRRAQRTMSRGFGNVGDRAFQRTINQLNQVRDGFRDLDDNARIRVRIDTSALRRADAQLAAWRASQTRNQVRVRVNPDPPNGRTWTRRIIGAVSAPLRAGMRLLGGTLSDGLGQGIANGFKGAGPVIMGALAVSILAGISVLGAAIAGALVLAIGGAFIGLGVFIASSSKKMRKDWQAALTELKPLFTEAVSGLLPVIEHARQQFLKIGKDFAPHFKTALDRAAPHVQTFMDFVISGFRKLGAESATQLEEAFNVFLAAFGPDIEETLKGMGDALAALANTVKEHSTEISGALNAIIGLITTAIDIVNFFANSWVFLAHSMSSALAFGASILGVFVDTVFSGLDGLIGIAEKAARAIGMDGMADKLAGARSAMSTYRDGVMSDIGGLQQRFATYSERVDHANRKRILEVDITSAQNQLRIARDELKRVDGTKAEPKVRANIAQLERAIGTARAQLNNLNGKTAHTYIITHMQARQEGSHGTELGYAHGGVIGAAATGGVRSNMTLVGEQGPELLDLPTGSRVRSNSDSRRLMGADQGNGGGGSTLVLKSSGRRVDDMLIEILREAIHQRGGDPVTVLGGR